MKNAPVTDIDKRWLTGSAESTGWSPQLICILYVNVFVSGRRVRSVGEALELCHNRALDQRRETDAVVYWEPVSTARTMISICCRSQTTYRRAPEVRSSAVCLALHLAPRSASTCFLAAPTSCCLPCRSSSLSINSRSISLTTALCFWLRYCRTIDQLITLWAHVFCLLLADNALKAELWWTRLPYRTASKSTLRCFCSLYQCLLIIVCCFFSW